MTVSRIVFLVDVDNTLLDNDRIQSDLKLHLEREFGFLNSSTLSWAIEIISAPCSVTGSNIHTIFTC
jgi:hypothetical protein